VLKERTTWDPGNPVVEWKGREVQRFASRLRGVTQMVNRSGEHSEESLVPQGAERVIPESNKIGASTAYDFEGKNLTAHGGLLPVATLLEKLWFRS
jgi:hypothetical protein